MINRINSCILEIFSDEYTEPCFLSYIHTKETTLTNHISGGINMEGKKNAMTAIPEEELEGVSGGAVYNSKGI